MRMLLERSVPLFVFAAAGLACYFAAVTPAKRIVADPVVVKAKPIPQDHERMERQASERLEWNRATLEEAYDRVGKKDPRWDDAAHKTLDLAARMFSLQVDPPITMQEVHTPAKEAIEAGCDDPLILYLFARTSVGPNDPGPEELTRRTQAAARSMIASQYPPFRRAVALQVLAEYSTSKKNVTPEERDDALRHLDADIDLLPESLTKDPRNTIWEDMWYRELEQNINLRMRLGVEDEAALDAVDDRLAKVDGIEALRLAVRGNFLYLWGWRARTTAFASAVSAERFQLFESRLNEAQTALMRSWELNHDQPHVATLLLDIEKSIGDGDREAMETWFERAMNADGNDRSACLTKLDWLDPKWHGEESMAEMLAFGEACRATGNWQAGITLLDGDAHLRYYSKFSGTDGARYLRKPDVWPHIEKIYNEYLQHFPDDDVKRSKYAFLCYASSHHWKADAEFKKLGDRLTTWYAFPNVPLERLKVMRDFSARVVTGKVH